ncbi:LysR family transcriptional regulator [Pseudooceanicola spongiae]|uniref:LysR family transcriptional regulator n=1 Tax=Pseudooceanicola spongiae TaxID=2613965 RepID=A0A7L9WN67_9RHOB|nr:LysR family transcriptional regulator [Pseudooceanicola spongiae]QOL80846.1 LysR family transcriptional regulator [Pseudooceanicola spongiae]
MIGALTLDQLRVLVAIADTGSFSAAGRSLGRVQSAISQSVASLETVQGVEIFDRSGYRPALTETGRVLVEQARLVLRGATQFEMVAANKRGGLEPELALAIDPLVASAPFIDALRDLSQTYPDLPISFSTEGLGGSLRRLRDGSAALGICTLLPSVPDDLVAYPLSRTVMRPVVGAGHPLAAVRRPVSTHELEPHVQLVLSDPVDPAGQNYGLASARLWRFADLNRRYDFVLAGFGWCRMPEHLVADALADGRLVELEIQDDTAPRDGLTIFAAHARDRVLGPGATHLLSALRKRFAA